MPHQPERRRRGALIGIHLVVAVLGYELGARGWLGGGGRAEASRPAARVGLALRDESPKATADDWAALRDDVEAVRAALKPEARGPFDLVAALRGLENGGETDWSRAIGTCQAIKWPRCDRAALEEMKRRSRP